MLFTGSVDDRHKSGRKRVTSMQEDSYIVMQHLLNIFQLAHTTTRDVRNTCPENKHLRVHDDYVNKSRRQDVTNIEKKSLQQRAIWVSKL